MQLRFVASKGHAEKCCSAGLVLSREQGIRNDPELDVPAMPELENLSVGYSSAFVRFCRAGGHALVIGCLSLGSILTLGLVTYPWPDHLSRTPTTTDHHPPRAPPIHLQRTSDKGPHSTNSLHMALNAHATSRHTKVVFVCYELHECDANSGLTCHLRG